MNYPQQLQDFTESYLKSLIADVSGKSAQDFDPVLPFGELGVDSFHVLKIVKKLEVDFGHLPKTLLFERFNIRDLSNYFVENFPSVLQQKLTVAPQLPTKSPQALSAASIITPKVATNSVAHPQQNPPSSSVAEVLTLEKLLETKQQPILLLQAELAQYPALQSLVKALFNAYKNEGSVARGTAIIAPNLFIGCNRRGYFNYSRSGNIILAYAYTGPEDYFYELSQEIFSYCQQQGFQLNLLTDFPIGAIAGAGFSSTPFGAVQRVTNIKEFTLAGTKMRRLRYLVNKFEESGRAETREYSCGSDPAVDANIVDVINKWCESRTMVNPLIYVARDQIGAGVFSKEHRLFLTYLDDVLQNVCIISPLSPELNGYLMDLEFYPADMPLGGLEYCIAKMIELLVAEGCDLFSMGATLGPKLEESPSADPELDKILDNLREREIFNDAGNLQFKNKFRPDNKSILLSRPVENSQADNIVDIIMMIADPERLQTSDEEHHTLSKGEVKQPQNTQPQQLANSNTSAINTISTSNRVVTSSAPAAMQHASKVDELGKAGFNPINLEPAQVIYDLKTDSWAQLDEPWIQHQVRILRARMASAKPVEDVLRERFGFRYFSIANSGREAEGLFFSTWSGTGKIFQNLLFPTTIYHQINNGFTPVELPAQGVFQLNSNENFKGNIDLEKLRLALADTQEPTAMVLVELNDNAAGGMPVSLAHLKELRKLLEGHQVPLVLDATRVLENAWFIVQQEPGYQGKEVWQVVRELLAQADAVLMSLAKDFCIHKGGFVATNNQELHTRLEQLLQGTGVGMNAMDKKLLSLALENDKGIAYQTHRRMEHVSQLWRNLKQAGVPVVSPSGGHCVLVDVKQLQPFAQLEQPVASFLAWLQLNTGIRAGAHNAGMQKATAINDLVRIAVPVGMSDERLELIGKSLVAAFSTLENIPDLSSATATKTPGDIHAPFALKQWLNANLNSPVFAAANVPGSIDTAQTDNQSPILTAPQYPVADIAIIGMAGRYPKAQNLQMLWDNITSGLDCTEDISLERLAMRGKNDNSFRYRGGFIDAVDQFDTGFFNIAAAEAALLDPQERLFLEVAWETLEDAGYFPESIADANRDVGVFVGAVWSMYQILGAEEKLLGNNLTPNSFLWSIANRVSFWMNFSGPSMTVDTACSSSLTALKLACDALRNGECQTALVGGVNLDLHQTKFDINSAGGALSKDGVNRSFGEGANGYVQGEGVGALLLKPLHQAERDGDNIYAVIRSVAVNHTGRSSRYTIPNPQAQTRLIRRALEQGNIDPQRIGFIEAHGTATDLGDAIEISGLSTAFESLPTASIPIGTVKTNIGHLEAAAGVVGIQKVLLQMQHQQLVPSLHSTKTNDNINFARSPFHVQQLLSGWPKQQANGVELSHLAGVSCFGAGGSNAHVILEEYRHPVATESAVLGIFPLSARTEAQLMQTAERLLNYLKRSIAEARDNLALQNIAHTLQVGRKSFEYRLVILASSLQELIERLELSLVGRRDTCIIQSDCRKAEKITGLLNKQEKQQFIDLLASNGDPQRLAQLWADGVLENWLGAGLHQPGRKVSLPTYPFTRESHWLPLSTRADGVPGLQTSQVIKPIALDVDKNLVKTNQVVSSAQVVTDLLPAKREVYRFEKDLPGELSLPVPDKAEWFVKQLFANQLCCEAKDIQGHIQLMDTGITSLDMAAITQQIKTLLDPHFSPASFFSCTSVSSLYEQFAENYAQALGELGVYKDIHDVTPSQVNWLASNDQGQQLHLLDAAEGFNFSIGQGLPQAYAENLQTLLLTGATGFLGVHILAQMMEALPETKVICIVRAQSAEHGRQRILDKAARYKLNLNLDQLEIICGDLEQPQLGLADENWRYCAEKTQQIIHASAHVNHIEGYASFRESTRGMKEIIRLAASHSLKLIHFVSSIAGCTLKQGNEFSIYEHENFVAQGEEVYGGYGQSKWVQEQYLKQANEFGIPYVIYRFGELSGSSKTGLGQTDDMLHRLLQMRLSINCREKISNDVLDMVPIDYAAQLIVKTAQRPEFWNRIFHATHTKPYSFANVYRIAEKQGLEFKPVSREAYLASCYEYVRQVYEQDSVKGFVLECVLRDAEGSVRKRKVMDGYFAVLFPFDQNNFLAALKDYGIKLPDWKNLIERYLLSWQADDSGFMAKVYEYRMNLAKREESQELINNHDLKTQESQAELALET